jgi:alanyl-tRNA synthetase
MANLLTSGEGVVALLAAGREKLHFIFARSGDIEADMRPLIKAACAVVDGKGGGKPEVCQGGGSGSGRAQEALEEAMSLLADSLGA